jgi:hypothetical protein
LRLASLFSSKPPLIPVPVPASGVSREVVVRAREYLEGRAKCFPPKAFLGALRGNVSGSSPGEFCAARTADGHSLLSPRGRAT